MGSFTLHSTLPPAFMSKTTSRPLSRIGRPLLSYSATRQSLRAEYSITLGHHTKSLPPLAASQHTAMQCRLNSPKMNMPIHQALLLRQAAAASTCP